MKFCVEMEINVLIYKRNSANIITQDQLIPNNLRIGSHRKKKMKKKRSRANMALNVKI